MIYILRENINDFGGLLFKALFRVCVCFDEKKGDPRYFKESMKNEEIYERGEIQRVGKVRLLILCRQNTFLF